MKQKFLKYVVIILSLFFFIMGMFYIKKAYGMEYTCLTEEDYLYEEAFSYDPEIILQNIAILQLNALCYDDCKTYKEKYQFHKENAERCFNDAKNKCWWIPNIDDREKARYCLINIGALLTAGDLQSKVIATIVATLIQYGVDCCDEWNDIQTKLKWAKYHYEMMEFFDEVMKQNPNNGGTNQSQQPKRVLARKHAWIPPSNIIKKKI
ncbi:MAG: hypothetical protein Q8K60_07695 [Parachlamydiaceae bacterium]|nr:hypothetical protein [Parachlamydiaceae bacterium]